MFSVCVPHTVALGPHIVCTLTFGINSEAVIFCNSKNRGHGLWRNKVLVATFSKEALVLQ